MSEDLAKEREASATRAGSVGRMMTRRRDQTKRTRRTKTVILAYFSSDVTGRGILLAFTKDSLAQAVYDYDLDMIDS